MSDQPPLTPPSGDTPGDTPADTPGFTPYDAPAYGDVSAEEPTRAAPYVPPTPFAPPAPPAPPAAGTPAAWAPYPTTPQGAPAYQLAPQYAAFGAPTHPQATTSLVLGIVGLVGILGTPFVLFTILAVGCSPFAIWLGVRARREIRANPQAYGGDGVALGGIITGIIGVVLGVLAVIAVVAVIGLFVAIFSASA